MAAAGKIAHLAGSRHSVLDAVRLATDVSDVMPLRTLSDPDPSSRARSPLCARPSRHLRVGRSVILILRVSCCSTARFGSDPFRACASRKRRACCNSFGCETRIFDPATLPLPDQVTGDDHPAVHELRELSMWSEGHVWCSPERHGQITGIMKLQVDHLPLSMGGMRPTQGRTLAVMQVSAGSQSFNSVNTLRVLGRWMRMVTIPNQSSVAKAFNGCCQSNAHRSPHDAPRALGASA